MQNILAEREVEHFLSISDVSRVYNVTFRTLRFYEQKGLLTPIRHRNDRLYSRKDEIRLQLILRGKRLGFSLREIGEMISSHLSKSKAEPQQMRALLDLGTVERQLKILESQRADVNATIAELKAALV